MRVLLLTEFFPATAAGEITGGVEARCFYVARSLGDRYTIRVLAARTDGSVWAAASAASIPRRIGFMVRMLWFGLRIPADLVEGTNQVVHPVAWLIARLRRKPLVYFYADVFIGQWNRLGSAGWIGELIERISIRLLADRYIAITETVAAKLRQHGVPPTRIEVIPCGFDEELVASALARQQPYAEPSIALVGRLVQYKGAHHAIEALAALRQRGASATLRIIGRGPEEEELKLQAQRLGIADSVHFMGYLRSHRDVLIAMASSTVLVAPSTIEGFGIVLMEAMALGVPYVASDIPAFREITSGGRGGRLFGPGAVADLVSHLLVLLRDPALRQQLSREGREHAQSYTWRAAADLTAGLWDEVGRAAFARTSASQ